MVAINERRYLGEVIPNYIESESKTVPASGINNKYWIITIDEVPGSRPEVISNLIVSTDATFTSLLKTVSNKIPAIGEYAIEGQDVYFNSFYASTPIYFRYYGIGSIVKQQDLDTLSAQIAALSAGSVTPAGSLGDIQFNNAGSLGASPLFNWNDTSKRLTLGIGSILRVVDGAGAGKVLTSDLNGDLTLQAFSGIPAGSDRQIQFNSSSSFGASSNLTFTAGNKLVITGTVQITGGVPGLNKVLTSDASGNATWENSVAIAGGVDGDIQFKSGVNFAGNSELNWDNGNVRLTLGSLATLRIITGAGVDKILSSDANGDATWETNPVFVPGGAFRIPFANAGGTALTDSVSLFTNASFHLFAPYLGLGNNSPVPGSTVLLHSKQSTGDSYFVNETGDASTLYFRMKNSIIQNDILTGSTGHMEFHVGGVRSIRIENGVSADLLYLDSNDRVGILQPTSTARFELLAPSSNTDPLMILGSVDDGNLLKVDNTGGVGIGVDATSLYKINLFSTDASGTQLKIENSGTGNTGILIKNSVEGFLNYVTSSGEYRVFGDAPCFRIDVAAPNTALWIKGDGNIIHKQVSSQTADSWEIQDSSSSKLFGIDNLGNIDMIGTNGIFWGDTGVSETTANVLTIKTANTTVLTADANQNVNIPNGRLTYQGTFASIFVDNASTPQSIATGSTHTKSTAYTTNSLSSNCTADAANDKITIDFTGKYRFEATYSYMSGTNNVVWHAAIFVNNVEQTQILFDRKVGTGTDVGNSGHSGFFSANATDDVDVRWAHDQGGAIDLTITQSNINVEYIGE